MSWQIAVHLHLIWLDGNDDDDDDDDGDNGGAELL